MQPQSNNSIQNANGDARASATKRKPPKLRPPKMQKGSPSDPETSGFSEKRVNDAPDPINSNSVPATPGSNPTYPRQNDRRQPSPQPAPQVEAQNQRTRHHQRHRRTSAQSQYPDMDQDIEREQRDNRSTEQRRLQDRRVGHILNTQKTQGQIDRASELVPRQATGAVEQVTETEEVKPQPTKNDQLKLRLDLNLDVEVELKAKIRGDLTLQLLYVSIFYRRLAILPGLLTCMVQTMIPPRLSPFNACFGQVRKVLYTGILLFEIVTGLGMRKFLDSDNIFIWLSLVLKPPFYKENYHSKHKKSLK